MTRIRIAASGWFPAMVATVRPMPRPRPAYDPATHRRSDFKLAA